jgi:hypothetical protein
MKWKDYLLQSKRVGWYGIALLTLVSVYFGTGRLGLSLDALAGLPHWSGCPQVSL